MMGIIGIMQKIHQNSEYKNELFGFLASAFLFSMIFSVFMSKRNKRSIKLEKKHCILAVACGVCTFLMNFLNLRLSGLLPSQLFFPVVNGGAIILSSVVSVAVFREKITGIQLIGLIGGILSLIVLCLVK